MVAILGYWKIRGLAQQIRLLMEYVGEPYKEELYECGPAPEYSRESWLSKKHKLDLAFPNLPYYIDGDFRLTQSDTILRYIAEKHNMGGKTPAERAQLSMINGALNDLRMKFVHTCYSPGLAENKNNFLKDLPDALKMFQDHLSNREWISGEKIDYPDFNLYDLLDAIQSFEPGALKQFPKLQDFLRRFEEIPKIKAYMSSPRYMKWPFNNKMAQWGGDS
ncbi:unnamed protein product [Calicophoron daubneyi]|uniref:glutathione transferase n=1 Tax=Calicophoron daubneyi TaxID=300641 RepID=A0AAV2TEA4_CALDB